ncbi:MAG: hypothetical protein ABIQ16_17410 [Polyangiaceae bacterium]
MLTQNLAFRGLFGLSLGLALSLGTPSALAAKGDSATTNAKKKVVVGAFTGNKSDQARKAVLAALNEDGAYEVSESTAAKPGDDDKTFAKASDGASAVLVGTVSKSGLVLAVHNGADGALVQKVEVKGESAAKLSKNIADALGLSIADPIAQTKPGAGSQAEAEPEAQAEPEAKEEEEQPSASDSSSAAPSEFTSDSGRTPLELTAGLRAVHRSFSYHDTPSERFPQYGFAPPRTYALPLGPAVFIEGSLFPGAWATRGPGSWFGLTAGYELNIATKSVYGVAPNEKQLTTRANQWFFGGKARIPVSAHEFGLSGGVGTQVFNLLGDEDRPQVPDVWYKFYFLRAEGRLRFNAVSLGFHLGTRLVHNTGGLERDWFAHVKTQSVEAGISVGYTLATNLEVVGGIDHVRYAFDFNPLPPAADPSTWPIAGGAVDQYTSGWLGLRYSLPHN